MKQVIITGIFLPIVVGIVLLLLEHKVIAPKQDENSQSYQIVQLSSQSNNSKNFSEIPHQAISKALVSDAKLINPIELRAQISIADQIYGIDPRDIEYLKIIDRALLSNNFDIAVEVVNKLYNIDKEDDYYEKLINYALNYKKIELAEQMASEIYNLDRKDSALKLLLEVRTKGY
jgi:hypothetical protein